LRSAFQTTPYSCQYPTLHVPTPCICGAIHASTPHSTGSSLPAPVIGKNKQNNSFAEAAQDAGENYSRDDAALTIA
jgi:hypothetical protein